MSHLGSAESPLPAKFYIPGDRVWFRNPDPLSADVTGYEGSFVFYLGNGPVKGFAVTLCVGLITSFFTAFTVSRLMVSKYLMNNKFKVINI